MYTKIHINKSFSNFMNKYDKLIIVIFDLLKHIKKDIPNTYQYSIKYPPKRSNYKYTDKLYIACILHITLNNSSWSSFIGPIEGKQVHKRFREYCKYNLFQKLFNKLVKTYLEDSEIDFLLTDTTNVFNKLSIECSKGNPYYKNKKVIKVSAITDSTGIPLNVSVYDGNNHDSKCLQNDIIKIAHNSTLNNKIKKFQNRVTLIADKGYDAKIIKIMLRKRGINSIIKPNNRNTKALHKIRSLNSDQERLYKKRIKVEHLFSWIKKYPKINCIYEKSFESYKNLLLLVCSKIINDNIIVK